MTATWQLTFKPTFLHELNALESKSSAQVLKKLDLLAADPTPDAKTKKQLRHLDGKLHRLRAGDYRVFYTFQAPFVSLLSIKRRDEKTYDDEVESESLGGLEIGDSPPDKTPDEQPWDRWLSQPKAKASPLARTIDASLLAALHVPTQFHAALTKVATEEELLDCPVPQDVLDRVIDAVTGRPLAEVVSQPNLVLAEPEDLLRYREGELLGFLLHLEPEQQKLVRWAIGAKGATLLKGGPGTGKSTVALYRVREVLAALKKAKVESPKVLFTTYTRALTRVSEQLLRQLVGADGMKHVEVKTADAVVRQIAVEGGAPTALARVTRQVIARAIEAAKFVGSGLKVASQRELVARVSKDFLIEEILGVIEGRGLATLDEYLSAARPGRRVSLSKVQREAAWRVREALISLLASEGTTTTEGWRRRAAERVKAGEVEARYDAVILDEAQDLSPTALTVLVGLCKRPSGVFVAADANQSIYGAGFRWSDVHDWLRFQGRTAVLHANHRSTREIGDAAQAYLTGSAEKPTLEDDAIEPTYVHAGPIPAVRAVASDEDEILLLARFFRQASCALKLGLGSGAVLAPTKDAASAIAMHLTQAGVPAKYVTADNLDLTDPGVKVATLKNAKGLEFPIVALAGFSGAPYPYMPAEATEEERDELVARERRTMFVAMTRAMRALLVVVPAEDQSALLQGFTPPAWNDGREKGL